MTVGEGLATGIGLFGASIALATLITRLFPRKEPEPTNGRRPVTTEMCAVQREGITSQVLAVQSSLAKLEAEVKSDVRALHRRIDALRKEIL